jgi:hypothetical protein
MIKKRRVDREKVYNQIKGAIMAYRSMVTTQADKDTLAIFEAMIEGFKSFGDYIDLIFEALLAQNKRIVNLESEVAKLRNTLDTLNENR